jgi:hypothetical protein
MLPLLFIHGHSCSISFSVLDHDDHELLLGLTEASLHPRDLVFKFSGTLVPLIHNPLDEDFDDLEAPILSYNVVDEYDFDIDWFEDQGISMVPAVSLSQSHQASFDALKLSCFQSFATEYDSLGCCTLSKHKITLDSRIPIFSHP